MHDVLRTLQTALVTAQYSRLDARWHAEDGPEPYGRFYLLTEGACILRHHGREFRLRPGTVHVIPAGSPLAYRCPRRMSIHWVHFTAQVLGGLDLFAYLHSPFSYRPRDLGRTVALLRQLERLAAAGGPPPGGLPPPTSGRQLQAAGLLMQLLCPFVDLPPRAGEPPAASSMSKVVGYIEAHLGQKMAIGELAGRAGLSREAFTRQFAAAFGRPPAQFIRRRRIDAVMQKLAGSSASLSQIARELGFTDAFHLSRTFRAVTGVPPSEFRQRRPPQP